MNNIKLLIKCFLVLLSCCFWGLSLKAQVFPGDANNNGEVDNVDLLYIGYAFGQFGPARLDIGVEFAEQAILVPWQQEFPDGLNYAYADTDGDGLVDLNDLLTVFINYGETTGIITPIEFPVGITGVDPSLDLQQDAIPNQLAPGSEVTIPLTLGTEENPVEDINGIAFSIRFNQEIVDYISLELNAPWFSPDAAGNVFHFQNFPVTENGVLDVAMTRFGQQPISGYGEIGTLSIVIEDDLLDLLPGQEDSLEAVVEVEEIFMLNSNFETVPVAADHVTLMLYHPHAITGVKEPEILNGVTVFPNPASHLLQVESPVDINAVRVLDLLGHELWYRELKGNVKVQINSTDLQPGSCLLEVYTDKGVAVRKVIVMHD